MYALKGKFILFALAIILIIILTVLVFFSFSQTDNQDDTGTTPIKQTGSENKIPAFKTITNIPTTTEGIDENSIEVKNSIKEIENLYPHLPYSEELVSSTGVDLSILIPSREFQTNSFTLSVEVFGIDYNMPVDDPNYSNMQASFLEGAEKIFSFIKSKNVDPKKIIFSWGDRLFIQERAQEWLKDVQ